MRKAISLTDPSTPFNTRTNYPGLQLCYSRSLRILLGFLLLLTASQASGQVEAIFRATDTAGCAPLIIYFNNFSKGATNYHWDLGNGITSTAKEVSASYVATGTYTVTLSASNGITTDDSTIIVRVYGKPTVNFSTVDTAVCPGAPIKFKSTSVSNAWGGLSYTWNFGDGSALMTDSPVYDYSSPGYYNVTLFAINTKGCTNTRNKTSYIHVYDPPSVLFSAPVTYFCKAPAVVNFKNTATGWGPLTYSWYFGDGGVSSAPNPPHTYTTSGYYPVRLTVSDGHSCRDSLTESGYIGVSGFKAAFSPIPSGCLKTPVKFYSTGSPYTYIKWDFGDGFTLFSDTGVHTYAAPGTYTVKMVVGNDTCFDSVTHPITILSSSAPFTVSQACTPPGTLNLSTTPPSGASVTWLYGDGSMAMGSTSAHMYPISPPPPVYKISMVLTNGIGCEDTTSILDTIKNRYPSLLLSYPQKGCVPLTTNFKVFSEYVFKNPYPPCLGCDNLALPYPYPITNYSWDFGDGSPVSTAPNPAHVYTAVGIYLARCHIVYSNGCTDDTSIVIGVGAKQTAAFSMYPTRVCSGTPITYVSHSTDPAIITNYEWTFGDYSTGVYGPLETSGTHRPNKPGIHEFVLTVFHNGCASKADTIVDTVDAPNARIHNHYSCIPANGMIFTDGSEGDDRRLWQFGDGATDTAKNPVHYYPDLKKYKVILTTHNTANGCRDTSETIIDLKRLSATVKPFDTAVCKDARDTVSVLVHGKANDPDSSWGERYKWYNNGVLIATHAPVYTNIDTFRLALPVRGVNNITLIITDNHSCLDTFTSSILVAKPIDSFGFAPPTVCPSSSVNFTDMSRDVPGASIVKYSWFFGDGKLAVTGSPAISHVYTTAGTYTVKEIVVDNIGCSDTFTNPLRPVVHRPKANFAASSTFTCESTTISFNNTSTGSIKYLWTFGDGSTSTLALPVHVYTAPGKYTVDLVAYDLFGCTDTLHEPDYVLVNPLPVASFHMDDSFAVCPPLNVNFINTSTGATTYSWDFGDGTYSGSVYPSNIYLASGMYTVQLRVSNSFGCIDNAVGHARVFGYVGDFSYTPSNVCASSPVHFSAILSDVINIVWDFSDGIVSLPSTLDTISHVYTKPGAYIPKLFLTDVAGCTKFSNGADTIKVDSIVAAFNTNTDTICQNSSVTFRDSSYSYFSSSAAWTWTFGAGATSTRAAPAYVFSVAGTQPVTLQVTNSAGCTASVTRNITVKPEPAPISGITGICLGQSVTLSSATGPGTWRSSNTAVAVVGSASGIVTSVTTGTSTISYTLTTGCKTITNATVSPMPLPITGIRKLCASETTTLSDFVVGGTWSSSNTDIATIGSGTGIVSGIATGTTTITYKLATGCFVAAIVTVDSSPVFISGATEVCAGSAIILSNAIAGGKWSSSRTMVALIGSATGVLTGVSGGTTTVTYALSSGCSTTFSTTVNALPAAITGLANVCAGLTIAMSDADAGGTWSSSATAVAVAGTVPGAVTGITSGTATITYELPTGCKAIQVVTVNPLPAAITGAAKVCVGSAVALSSGTVGGTWTSSGTAVSVGGSSGIVSGISAGTAVITYTLATGCIDTSFMMVDPLPATITGAKNICLGLTTSLSNASAGGTWGSVDPDVSVGALSGIITGLAIGTATISYTLPTGCYTTATVVVNRLPSEIMGIGLVCAGSTTILSDSVSGGTWGSSNTSVASVDGVGKVTGVAAGTAFITYTSVVGCTAITTVTVQPVITPINGTAAICNGTTATLTDDIAGGTWTSGNTAIVTISSGGIVTGVAVGTATISYTVLNTCGTATKIITVNPQPDAGTIAGPGVVCAGSFISLSNIVTGGTWASGDAGIATVDATGVVTGITAGSASITYTYTNVCGFADTGVFVTVNPVPPLSRITTHPDTVLCSNTLFQNFGADNPPPAGIHYVWKATNATIYASSKSKQYCLVHFNQPGTSVISLSTDYSSTGCTSADSINFFINPAEAPNPVVVYYDPEFVCKDNSAQSYQWGYDDASTLDSVLLPGMVNQNYTNTYPEFSNKHYWVLTTHNNCVQKSYYNPPLGINTHSIEDNIEILLYPNPADEGINIEVNGSGRFGIIDATVLDLLGKERRTVRIKEGAGVIKLNGMVPGVYVVLFSKDGVRIGSRVFVKK